MFQILRSHQVERLQDLALPLAVDKVLRDASKLSLRLCVDIYFYNYSGHRKIKKLSSIDFVDEKILFLVMEDDRIAAKGTECLSAILPENQALSYFKIFGKEGLNVHKDKSGLYYYEKKILPYNIIKGNITTFGDTSKWSDDDWEKYYDLWKKYVSRRPPITYSCFHLLPELDTYAHELPNDYSSDSNIDLCENINQND